jgi:hypothetical protein
MTNVRDMVRDKVWGKINYCQVKRQLDVQVLNQVSNQLLDKLREQVRSKITRNIKL